MNLCALQGKSNQENFLDIYNWSNFVIRYTGVYFVGGFGSRFCTLPFFPQDHIKVTFPDDATRVECYVQRWIVESSMWDSFTIVFQTFPGGYCYRASGTERNPSFSEILCP